MDETYIGATLYLLDSEDRKVDFEVVDEMQMRGNLYLALFKVGSKNTNDMVIFKGTTNDPENFIILDIDENEFEYEEIFEIFCDRIEEKERSRY